MVIVLSVLGVLIVWYAMRWYYELTRRWSCLAAFGGEADGIGGANCFVGVAEVGESDWDLVWELAGEVSVESFGGAAHRLLLQEDPWHPHILLRLSRRCWSWRRSKCVVCVKCGCVRSKWISKPFEVECLCSNLSLHHGVIAQLILRLLAVRVISLDGLRRLLQLWSPVQDKVWLVRCVNNILNPSRGWRRQRALQIMLCSERRQYRSSWEICLRAVVNCILKGAS